MRVTRGTRGIQSTPKWRMRLFDHPDQSSQIRYGRFDLDSSVGESSLYHEMSRHVVAGTAGKFRGLSFIPNVVWARDEQIARQRLSPPTRQAGRLDHQRESTAQPVHRLS